MAKLSEEQKTKLRRAAAEKRRTITAALKSKNAVERTEMLAAIGGPLRTVDGHILSEHNSLIIALQAAAAGVSLSLVGGFRQWKENGRIVDKGQRGFCFWYPLGNGAAAAAGAGDGDGDGEGDGDGDGESGSGRPRFGTAYYWDISQTVEIGAAGAAAGSAAGDSDVKKGVIEEMKKVSGEPAENLNLFNKDLFENEACASRDVAAAVPAAAPAPAAVAVHADDPAAALLAMFSAA